MNYSRYIYNFTKLIGTQNRLIFDKFLFNNRYVGINNVRLEEKHNFRSLFTFRKKTSLDYIGRSIYEIIVVNTKLEYYFKVFDIPDTFQSWFYIMHLQLWLLSVRLVNEENKGYLIKNGMINEFWLDFRRRLVIIETNALYRPEAKKIFKVKYNLGCLYYDYALLEDDQMMAFALWNTLFNRNVEDPRRLECALHFVRSNLVHLESITIKQFETSEPFKLKPLLHPEELETKLHSSF